MEVNKVGDIAVVSILTRVDANSAKEVEKSMAELLIDGAKKVICDFSKNEYISSAGLRVFLAVLKTMKKNNGSIILCSLQPQVHEIFGMAGFTPLFAISDTVDEAIQQLS